MNGPRSADRLRRDTVLDASALIAYLDASDALHGDADAAVTEASTDRFWLHPITLSECLVRAVGEGRDGELLAELASLDIATIAFDDEAPLRLARLRVSTGLKLPDCCVLDAAAGRNARVLTFDSRLRGAAADLGVPVNPLPPAEPAP